MQTFAIIPAAGRSERMGTAKLLLPWGSQPLIEHVLQSWQAGGVTHQIVVVHPEDTKLAEVCHRAGAIVCTPSLPPPEMKDSIAAALALVESKFHPEPDDAWLLAPADMPLLATELIQLLVCEYARSSSPIIVPQLADGRTGHPILLSWRLATEVRQLGGGIRQLRDAHPHTVVPWVSADSFTDVDTLDDYRRLHNRYHPHAQSI